MAARPTQVIFCLLGLIAAASGCTERPKAPALVNEPVYQYEKIGLRFLTPESWSITSRATLPPGPLTKPMMLVAYHLKGNEHPAALEVLAADLSEETDLGQYLLESRVGQGEWTIKSQAEKIVVNGAEATRYLLSQRAGKNEHLRETTAFRRGGRVYFFIVSFAATDPGSRDTGRKSIESVSWTKP
jgi:hypothetical protein